MIKGETKSGFQYEVDERILTDWNFMKALADAASKEGGRVLVGTVNAVFLLFGEDGEKKLCEHLKDASGHVDQEDILSELLEVMGDIGGKNS